MSGTPSPPLSSFNDPLRLPTPPVPGLAMEESPTGVASFASDEDRPKHKKPRAVRQMVRR